MKAEETKVEKRARQLRSLLPSQARNFATAAVMDALAVEFVTHEAVIEQLTKRLESLEAQNQGDVHGRRSAEASTGA